MIVVQGDKHQMMSEGKIHRLQICDIKPRDQGEYRFIAKDQEARAKLELAGKLLSSASWCPPHITNLCRFEILQLRQNTPCESIWLEPVLTC